MLVEGLAFKSQSLLCLGKIFNDLGRSPVSVVVDGAGELNSKHADLFYANRRTTKDATAAGQQWMNSRVERRHAVINQMTAASLRHAGAVTAFWWFCLQHMVFICNLLLLARDPKTRQALDKTVWEAHFGVRPNLRDYLIAPWGCMCYLVLTPDQRQARGADNAFGIRAIGGIYLGVVCNPRTPYVQHLMTDGKTIFTSPNNIRCVGDAFPFKWQRGRDIQLNLDGPPTDDETTQPASAMHAMPAPRALSAYNVRKRSVSTNFRPSTFLLSKEINAEMPGNIQIMSASACTQGNDRFSGKFRPLLVRKTPIFNVFPLALTIASKNCQMMMRTLHLMIRQISFLRLPHPICPWSSHTTAPAIT